MACPTDSHTGDCTRYLGKACRPSPSRETTATALGIAVTSIVLVTYGYRDTTTPHAAILQRPRYFRLVRALVRAPPPAGRSRARNGPNSEATTGRTGTDGTARLGLNGRMARGLRVSGERSGGRKPRAGAGAARRRGASPQPARPPARQPLARTPPPGTRDGAPPTRSAVSYFAPRFHSHLKGLSHLRIFIRQYILATPA